ncbi:zinc finger protein OZF-like [Pelobates fuscus]|uniref:zinc finger protein OZF-like n=1 Tax=Pelobates fuscus TaxID=191477 RepID=UPI002FE4419C
MSVQPSSEGNLRDMYKSTEHPRTQITSIHIEVPDSCEEENLTVLSAPNEHPSNHVKDKPASCEDVPQSETSFGFPEFPSKNSVVKYEVTDPEEKPYSCHECGKCFNQKQNLNMHLHLHLKRHTEKTTYSCPTCGKRFSCQSVLANHQRSHALWKPLECKKCGKLFNCSSTLLIHKRIHTGEKPHSCPECGKCFSRKYYVGKHRQTHGAKKALPNPKCLSTSSTSVTDAHTSLPSCLNQEEIRECINVPEFSTGYKPGICNRLNNRSVQPSSEGNLTDMYKSTEQSLTEIISIHIKKEPASCEEGNLMNFATPTEHPQSEYPSTHIKEEPAWCEEGNLRHFYTHRTSTGRISIYSY